METPTNSIIVDSCQYTPVYFIEDPNFSQARSYIVTQNATNIQKPVSDTLKRFYENSGKLENNLVSNVESSPKPRIIKKQDVNMVGNNLKLASFLMPKDEPKVGLSKQIASQVNNVVLKPVYIANSPNITIPTGTTTPKLDINSKIVKLNDIPNGIRSPGNGKILPKIKPKDVVNCASNSKHTSVQLLKLGETYHSLNQLSKDQMKIVNHALKIFSNPQNTPQEPTYDPITNTKYIYKVVSPKDLTVVGKNNMIFKPKKPDIKRVTIKKPEKKIPEVKHETDRDLDIPVFLENAVTRSGRKVKISKNILPEQMPKPKKKNGTIASCFQCSSKFSSLYRLQRHYDHHPTHVPENIHSNLFHCLLAIVKSGSEENSANIFLQQLEQFITKIRSCMPCLLKTDDKERKTSNVSEEIGRLLGISPGKYKLNMNAMNCIKDKNGYCLHNQPAANTDQNRVSEMLLSESNLKCDKNDSSDCARINSAEKWPTVSQRIEIRKQKTDQCFSVKKFQLESNVEANIIPNTKKMKLDAKVDVNTSPSAKRIRLDAKLDDIINSYASKIRFETNEEDNLITNTREIAPDHNLDVNIATDDIVALLNDTMTTDNMPESKPTEKILVNEESISEELNTIENEHATRSHIQFHSTHFDIRSSPIKPSSNTFRKFQINTENMPKYKVQTIEPLQLNQFANEIESHDSTDLGTHDLFEGELNKDTTELNFELTKDWPIVEPKTTLKTNSLIGENSSDSYMKSESIQPALLHVKDSDKPIEKLISDSENSLDTHLLSDQGHSMDTLNFLESLGSECISYSETDIRSNPVDFQLDLFSFNST